MKYVLTCLLICIGVCDLAAADQVLLKDGTRVRGTILQDTLHLLSVRDEDGLIQTFPQQIVSERRYADATDWGRLQRLEEDGSYEAIVFNLNIDIKKHSSGGSYRQVSCMLRALRFLDREQQVCELIHDACKHQRSDIIQIIDQAVVFDRGTGFAEREKEWLQTIKYSRYQLARRRCACILAAMYVLRGQQAAAQQMLAKNDVDQETDLQALLSYLTNPAQALQAQSPILHLDMHHAVQAQQLIQEQRYDAAALTALRFGLDPMRGRLKRISFLQLAEQALRHQHAAEADQVRALYQALEP